LSSDARLKCNTPFALHCIAATPMRNFNLYYIIICPSHCIRKPGAGRHLRVRIQSAEPYLTVQKNLSQILFCAYFSIRRLSARVRCSVSIVYERAKPTGNFLTNSRVLFSSRIQKSYWIRSRSESRSDGEETVINYYISIPKS
jgi:hypothetical protein